jgi:hypothetical protein
VDDLATNALKKRKLNQIALPGDRAQLWINNQQLTSKHTQHLREGFHSRQMYEH